MTASNGVTGGVVSDRMWRQWMGLRNHRIGLIHASANHWRKKTGCKSMGERIDWRALSRFEQRLEECTGHPGTEPQAPGNGALIASNSRQLTP
jgi:hypothetical protein